MRRFARFSLGALSGFVWGLGVAALIQLYGLRPLHPLLLYGLPLLGAVLSAAWTGFRVRGTTVAVAALFLADPARVVGQEPECEVLVEFPGGSRADLAASTPSDPIQVDPDSLEGLVIEIAGPGSFVRRRPELWIELGGFRIQLIGAGTETLTADPVRHVVTEEDLADAPPIPPGIYHVGGRVPGVCATEGYVRIGGNPFDHPAGWVAAGAVLAGLLGTWLTGRAGRGPKRSEQLEDRDVPESKTRPLQTFVAPVLPARTIQARLYDGRGRPLAGAFLPGEAHRIQVHFSPPDPATDAPGEPVELAVVLTEPRLLEVPLAAAIRVEGPGVSTRCEFTLTTLPDTERVDARLIVLSKNRVLQTARLPTEVRPATEPPVAKEPTDAAEPETVVRGSTESLERRRPFDAAFVVNHDDGGRARATGVTEAGARTIDLDETTIREAVQKIRRRLGEIVEQPEDFGSLEAEGTRELLVFLAHHGRVMRNALVQDFLGPALAGASHLQVVSARPDAYFPFEFAYDYPAPPEDAGLCPDARAALEGPGFPATCPREDHHGVVCPFGFWGISKVIERHAFQPVAELSRGFLVRGRPDADRDRLPLDGGALLAASERVDAHAAGSVERLVEALDGPTGGRLDRVEAWSDWTARVGTSGPAVLVLLPHTVYSDALESFGLEIGTADRIWVGDIDERYIPPQERPVIVALLGCETAAAGDVGYERFPALFRRAGAEVVVGTLTEVLGRHAAPVAGRLVGLLYEGSRSGKRAFGEVMVEVRRRFLAEGIPMALVLVAFGDADWTVVGAG